MLTGGSLPRGLVHRELSISMSSFGVLTRNLSRRHVVEDGVYMFRQQLWCPGIDVVVAALQLFDHLIRRPHVMQGLLSDSVVHMTIPPTERGGDMTYYQQQRDSCRGSGVYGRVIR